MIDVFRKAGNISLSSISDDVMTVMCGELDHATVYIGCPSEMGAVRTASFVPEVISRFSPDLCLMPGICAGRRGKTVIGDLLVAERAFSYSYGKTTEKGFLPSTREETPPENFLSWVRYNVNGEDWKTAAGTQLKKLGPRDLLLRAVYEYRDPTNSEWLWLRAFDLTKPLAANRNLIPHYQETLAALREEGLILFKDKQLVLSDSVQKEMENQIFHADEYLSTGELVKVEPKLRYTNFASGPNVETNTVKLDVPGHKGKYIGYQSEAFHQCSAFDRKVDAIEMEAFAFYSALKHHKREIGFLAFKAVADHADAYKNDGAHEFGMRLSAAFALEICRRYIANPLKKNVS